MQTQHPRIHSYQPALFGDEANGRIGNPAAENVVRADGVERGHAGIEIDGDFKRPFVLGDFFLFLIFPRDADAGVDGCGRRYFDEVAAIE
ncbi:MAG: hypothetical protein ACREAB_06685 [Blastocatellia bacterium]